jgi:hypothetical protein
MISELQKADKLAAVPAEPIVVNPNTAVSLRVSWKQVSELVDLGVPLRRPKRTTPSPLPPLKQELDAWEAASDEAWESIDD